MSQGGPIPIEARTGCGARIALVFFTVTFGCLVWAGLGILFGSQLPDDAAEVVALAGPTATIAPPVATATPRPTSTPRPTATRPAEARLQVASYRTYPAVGGGLFVVGELVNNGSVGAQDISVGVALVDDRGAVVDSSSFNTAALQVARPKERFPFRLLLEQVPPDWKEVRFAVRSWPYRSAQASVPDFAYLDLVVDRSRGKAPRSAADHFVIDGVISNRGRETAELLYVVGVAYDRASKVIDVTGGLAPIAPVAPGAVAPFTLEFPYLREAPARYDVLVQGAARR